MKWLFLKGVCLGLSILRLSKVRSFHHVKNLHSNNRMLQIQR